MTKNTSLKAVEEGINIGKASVARDKLTRAQDEMSDKFVEREAEIKGLFIAWLAGVHALLLGPPGTAKSLLARTFSDVVAGGSFFQWLLTKFSSPEELFGPVSFSGLKSDKFERVTTGKLPEAEVAFLDEIFKANSSILNALLTALNEGLFFNGTGTTKIPLQLCVGASNELPEDASLDALYDRFLLRFWVNPIADRDALSSLLTGGMSCPTVRISAAEAQELRYLVDAVPFEKADAKLLLDVKAAVEAEGFKPTDRTWVHCVQILKAAAVVEGRDKIIPADYRILADVLWREAKDRAKLAQVIGNSSDPYGSRAQAIADAAKSLLRELPDLSVLDNGQKTKWEVIDEAGKVSQKLTALKEKLDQVILEAGYGNPSLDDALDRVEKAIDVADGIASKAVDHKEAK